VTSSLGGSLDGCPGTEHLVWLLTQWTPGAASVDPASIGDHFSLVDAPPPEALAAWWHQMATSNAAVAEVLGWRSSRFGQQVVTYRALDGRDYDYVSTVEPGTGRLVGSSPTRSANGVDIGATPVAALTDEDRAAVHVVFGTAFRDADHDALDDRLGKLQTVALGWRDTDLLGFAAVGMREADLPVIGHRSFLDCGITCVDPAVRNRGLSNAIGSEAMRADPRDLPNEFALLHFATPVTLRAAFRFGRSTWPGTTIAEVAAALESPTSCQRAVGAALAELSGATEYDAEHWVLRAGRPMGDSTADPTDLEPEYAQLFTHVDPRRGDALLGVFWWIDPPSEWWT
jgi:hypothetical protein